eukprot:gene2370-2932_t
MSPPFPSLSSQYSVEHMLLMHLKDDLSDDELKVIHDKIQDMRTIPGVITISFGKNFDKNLESSGKIYNYGYRVLFRDEKDLDVYQAHKYHEEFKEIICKVRVKYPLVCDYLIPKIDIPIHNSLLK